MQEASDNDNHGYAGLINQNLDVDSIHIFVGLHQAHALFCNERDESEDGSEVIGFGILVRNQIGRIDFAKGLR
jgi:hypothetical protein